MPSVSLARGVGSQAFGVPRERAELAFSAPAAPAVIVP